MSTVFKPTDVVDALKLLYPKAFVNKHQCQEPISEIASNPVVLSSIRKQVAEFDFNQWKFRQIFTFIKTLDTSLNTKYDGLYIVESINKLVAIVASKYYFNICCFPDWFADKCRKHKKGA